MLEAGESYAEQINIGRFNVMCGPSVFPGGSRDESSICSVVGRWEGMQWFRSKISVSPRLVACYPPFTLLRSGRIIRPRGRKLGAWADALEGISLSLLPGCHEVSSLLP